MSTFLKTSTHYRRNLTLLYLFQGASHLWFDGALWVIYWQHRGLSLFEVGIFEATLHVVSLLLDIPMGIFADRIGWKFTLVLSSLAGTLYCVCSLLPGVMMPAIFAGAFRGLQITLANGSDMAITYETAKQAGHQDAYQKISGRMMAVQLLALGVAEALGGVLASRSWTYVYVLFALANVASGVIASLLIVPKPVAEVTEAGEHEEEISQPSLITIAREAWQFARAKRSYRLWIAYSAILSGFIATFSFYGQSFLHEAGWSTTGIGVLTGVECGISSLASILSATLTKVMGAASFGFIAVMGMTFFSWLPSYSKGVGYLLTQASGSAVDPLIDKSLNDIVPSSHRATLLSANSTAFSLFMVFVFPLFGALTGHIGFPYAYRLVSGLLMIVCIVIGFVVVRKRRRDNKPSHSATCQ